MAQFNFTAQHFEGRSNISPLKLQLEEQQIYVGGSPRACLLQLPLEVEPTGSDYQDLKIHSGSGCLFYGHVENRSIVPWFKDRLAISDPLYLPQASFSTIHVVFQLTRQAIESIEEKRDGKDVVLTLAMNCILYWPDQSHRSFVAATSNGIFTISANTWEEQMLTTWGYLSHHFVQWTAPVTLDPQIAEAHEEYKSAEQCFLKSDWNGTLVALRNCYSKLISMRHLDLPEDEPASFGNRIRAFKKQVLEEYIGGTRAEMIGNIIEAQIPVLSTPTKPDARLANRSLASLHIKLGSIVLSYISDAFEAKL